MSPLLDVRNLHVAIGDTCVCRDLSLTLEAGQRLAILGRNGAGKSTLLSVLAGLRPPLAGRIHLRGIALARQTPHELAKIRGWLGQQIGDPFASSVLETVLTGRHPHLGRWDWEGPEDLAIAHRALAAVGLSGFGSRHLSRLSGGERQRVAIATLLTQAPQLYLLDEPLAHLDLNHQIAVLELFSTKARTENIALALVLHDPALAARYCDQVLLLHGNGDSETGPAATMLDANRLSRLYGHPLTRIDADGRTVFIPA
ncbi:MAG: ABC transporter ATP-binding protein [Proteobacteria bacterium]|nr:ABC transporter ATP-binding protein [Pseudomonadota bacterium]HQR04462.1 ABC transporter ATP-binding protein [Rhodocyclaceae bacterium]